MPNLESLAPIITEILASDLLGAPTPAPACDSHLHKVSRPFFDLFSIVEGFNDQVEVHMYVSYEHKSIFKT